MRNHKFSKKLIAVMTMAVLIFSMVFTGCGKSDSASDTTSDSSSDAGSDSLTKVRLGVMTGNADQWYAIVGNSTGIYKKHGLEVEVTEYAAGINTVDALTTDQLDIGFTADFAGINRIGNTQDQTTLRYISNITASTRMDFYVNPEKISGLADVKGKKILVLPGTVWEYWTAKAVEAAGTTVDDVEYVKVDSNQDALVVAKKGNADAFWASGEQAKRLEEYGWKSILSQEDLDMTTYSLYMSTEEYVANNQDTVVKFLEATQDIIKYIQENEDDAADLVYNSSGMGQDIFKSSVEAITLTLDFTQDTYDVLQGVADWTYQNGYYDKEFSVADYIATDALSKVDGVTVDWKANNE